MQHITRSPFFWLLFILAGTSAAFMSYWYFPKAFPIVHLDLTMNRGQAVDAAQTIAQEFNLGPAQSSVSTVFDTDNLVKTFVELEGGGKEQLVSMMDQNLYQLYTWNVRHFKQYDPHEVTFYFTPQGKPYGFTQTISEDAPGAALSSPRAQTIAEQFIANQLWNIDLSEYDLVESSQETKPSKRVDHLFLYERPNIKIGDGFYRLRVVVSGDKVSQIMHQVKVPESFIRTYSQMRSANENIAYAAKLALMLLYVIGGCIIGIFILLREHYVLWRAPIWCAALIAGMTTLQHLNSMPILWMHYNTALSSNAFIAEQLLNTLIEFVYWFFILSLSFAAAESLTRKAFGNQLQLWQVWNQATASSLAILGRTIGGYLLVPLMLSFTVCFYIITTTYFDWWNPSNALFDPNILANYLPWWESIAISLRAGFWEECLFRAVPLASAALLGNYFGKRNWWIVGAFIIQAVIFGAAHANYPAQPAYARLIELLVISSLFGGVYLKFGLLPSIIAHFAYDVMWISLPIFISHASSALSNKLIVIGATLIPLLIVLYARFKKGKWLTLSPAAYNRNWHPEPIKKQNNFHQQQQFITLSSPLTSLLFILGIGGLFAWVYSTQFISNGLPFTIDRYRAKTIAQEILDLKKIDRSAWYQTVSPSTDYQDNNGTASRFIWQEGSHQYYMQLLGNYLTPPLWVSRFITFEGTQQERAQEHNVYLNPDGSLYRYTHIIPEDAPGQSLSKEDAKIIALAAIFKEYNLQSDQLIDISAIANKQPQRLDWIFTFAVPGDYQLDTGQARIQVTIGGNQLLDIYRYIHVPEQWQRDDENNQLVSNIIKQLCALAVYLMIILGSLYGFMHWRIKIQSNILVLFSSIIAAIFLFELFNSWPTVVAQFNTSQPFMDQLFRAFGMQTISLCMRALLLGLLFVCTLYWRSPYQITNSLGMIMGIGTSMGICTAGLQSLIEYVLPSTEPLWPNYTPLAFAFPLNAGINSYTLHFISLTIFILLITMVIITYTYSFTRNKVAGSLLLITMGIIMMGVAKSGNVPVFIASGLILGLLFLFAYITVARYSIAIIPSATAAYMILYALQQAQFNAYPQAAAVCYAASLLIMIISYGWSKKLAA